MKKLLNLTDKHVGSRVRMRRLMLDLSQSGLATALGVTFQQVQKYEKGANRISASRLHHISNVLQVPIPFFFEGLPRHSAASERTTDARPRHRRRQRIAVWDAAPLETTVQILCL